MEYMINSEGISWFTKNPHLPRRQIIVMQQIYFGAMADFAYWIRADNHFRHNESESESLGYTIKKEGSAPKCTLENFKQRAVHQQDHLCFDKLVDGWKDNITEIFAWCPLKTASICPTGFSFHQKPSISKWRSDFWRIICSKNCQIIPILFENNNKNTYIIWDYFLIICSFFEIICWIFGGFSLDFLGFLLDHLLKTWNYLSVFLRLFTNYLLLIWDNLMNLRD